jgi:hypothetical protein
MAVTKKISDGKKFHITYSIELTETKVNEQTHYRDNKTRSVKGNLEGTTTDVIKEIEKFLETVK